MTVAETTCHMRRTSPGGSVAASPASARIAWTSCGSPDAARLSVRPPATTSDTFAIPGSTGSLKTSRIRAGIEATVLPAAGSDETSVACAEAIANTRSTNAIARAAVHPTRRAVNRP
jgi:hypothetical protein